MKQDRVAEPCPVAVAIGSPLDGLNSTVDALGGGVACLVNDGVNDAEHVVSNRLRNRDEWRQARAVRPIAECVPGLARPRARLVMPELRGCIL